VPDPSRTVVLGIDTATVVCVGLAIDGDAVATGQVADRMAHVEQLTPLVRRVCADAGIGPTELTDVVVGLGPGPYTGLRVGIVTGRVLAELAGARLRGICSLDVIAAQHAAAGPEGEFVVVTDARRKEVYWARYSLAEGKLPRLEDGPHVGFAADLPDLPAFGAGAGLYADTLRADPEFAEEQPDALYLGQFALARLAGGGQLPDSTPLYLRESDAQVPGPRKRAL
jgi:tRNA threonylcarbamoyladenosine biosynthesis protein TsaB